MGSNQSDWMRLFMAPGMGHCGGGPGVNTFDSIGTLEKWVEKGIAPDTMMGTGAQGMTRPLCPYPQYRRVQGQRRCEGRQQLGVQGAPFDLDALGTLAPARHGGQTSLRFQDLHRKRLGGKRSQIGGAFAEVADRIAGVGTGATRSAPVIVGGVEAHDAVVAGAAALFAREKSPLP